MMEPDLDLEVIGVCMGWAVMAVILQVVGMIFHI